MYDSFSVHKDGSGNIFAREANYMKCVDFQYLETVRKYITKKLKFKRNIHMFFTLGKNNKFFFLINIYHSHKYTLINLDEKIRNKFVTTPELATLNVSFALDEGIALTNYVFEEFCCERT